MKPSSRGWELSAWHITHARHYFCSAHERTWKLQNALQIWITVFLSRGPISEKQVYLTGKAFIQSTKITIIIIIIFIECLLHVRNCVGHFTHIISWELWVLLLPFYTWRNWGTERLNDFPRVTELGSRAARISMTRVQDFSCECSTFRDLAPASWAGLVGRTLRA